MKKSIKGLIITILLMLPLVLNAATFKPSLSCPSSAKAGETVSCKVTATVDASVIGVEGKINIGNTTYVDFTYDSNKFSNFKVDQRDSSTIVFVGGKDSGWGSTTLTIGTLKVKIPASGSNEYTIRAYELLGSLGEQQDFATVSASDITNNIRLKSTDSSLKSLSVEGMTLGPNFNPSQKEYSLPETSATSITINAVANDSNAKISGAGTVNLKYGSNTITVTVTSESGATTKYIIKVVKTDTRDTVNTLKSLGVKNYTITPNFNSSTTTYSLNVEENVAQIEVTATLTSDKSSFTKGYGPRKVSLKYGKNAVQVKVKAENEKEKIYTINVNRKDNRNTNNYLRTLTISDGSIFFDKEKTNYTINVNGNLKEITVSATAESEKSKVTGTGTHPLNPGTNKIEIKVTAENEETKTYVLMVNRGESTEFVDTNDTNVTETPVKYLESLTIKDYDIGFKYNVFNYDVKIRSDVNRLDIDYKAADGYNVSIAGNDNLENGSVVKLIVGDSEGNTVEYVINVKKEAPVEEKKSNNLIFYIAIGAIGFVFLGMIVSIIFKEKPTPEEIVKQKYIVEDPTKVKKAAFVDGVSNIQVTGSIISQVDRHTSMIDTPDIEPGPIVSEQSSPTAIDEPTYESASATTNEPIETLSFDSKPAPIVEPSPIVDEMEPMPIGAPIVNEVPGDFTPNPEATITPDQPQKQINAFNIDMPEFDDVSKDQ